MHYCMSLKRAHQQSYSLLIAQPFNHRVHILLAGYEAMSDSRYISSYYSTTATGRDRTAIGTGGGAVCARLDDAVSTVRIFFKWGVLTGIKTTTAGSWVGF